MHYYDDENSPGVDAFVESDTQNHLPGVDEDEMRLQLLEEAIKALNEEQRMCIEMCGNGITGF